VVAVVAVQVLGAMAAVAEAEEALLVLQLEAKVFILDQLILMHPDRVMMVAIVLVVSQVQEAAVLVLKDILKETVSVN
jgi:hypothetical protein